MAIRRRQKPVAQRRWRTAPPGLAAVAKEKAAKEQLTPPPPKRPQSWDQYLRDQGVTK